MDIKKAHVSIELARKLIELHPELNDWVESKVPEIKEYEDEIIRKEIIKFLQLPHPQFVGKRRHEKWIAWLENYKKENTDDKPKPKFKVGDWIVYDGLGTYKVVEIHEGWYSVIDSKDRRWSVMFEKESLCHPWIIQDAKDGDTLTYYLDNGKILIFIYESLGESYDGQVNCHALLDGDYFSDSVGGVCCKFMEHLTPSTKEQHDLLYKKMKEKGYYFDEEEKILKGINKDKDETAVPVEDNSIKEELIKFLNNYINAHGCTEMSKWVSWIEKQDEQKPVDKVESKFKVGDWITDYKYTWKVTDIKPLDYVLQSQNGDTVDDTICYVDEYFHLWTIKDAKEYDILYYSDDCMVMVKDTNCNGDFSFNSYCQVDEGNFTKYSSKWYGKYFKPATENQRNFFFEYMEKAGYDYDYNTKKIEKIRF